MGCSQSLDQEISGPDTKFLHRGMTMREINDLVDTDEVAVQNNYEIGDQISSGIFYEVRRCVNRLNGKKRAVKVLRKNELTHDELKKLPLALENLKNVTNGYDNLLNIYGFHEDVDRFYIITEARKIVERCEIHEAVL